MCTSKITSVKSQVEGYVYMISNVRINIHEFCHLVFSKYLLIRAYYEQVSALSIKSTEMNKLDSNLCPCGAKLFPLMGGRQILRIKEILAIDIFGNLIS